METNIELLKLMRQAIKQGDINAVKEMVKKNAGLLEAVTPLGSWLHIAAECGNSVMVSYFIDAGLDVNTDGGLAEANPLKAAANNGHLDVVNILYQNGAQFETEEATKNPLFGAIYGNHIDVVRFLVENGIDITKQYKIGNIEKCNVYEYARQFGRTQIADYLKEKSQTL